MVNLEEFLRLRRLLAQLDHTSTRFVNRRDLNLEMERLKIETTADQIAAMIAAADVDNDGRVDIFEFWRLLTCFPVDVQQNGLKVAEHWRYHPRRRGADGVGASAARRTTSAGLGWRGARRRMPPARGVARGARRSGGRSGNRRHHGR